MFEFVRTHQRLMQFILLLFIFPSFAFFGLESYSRFSNSDNAVAKVAGQSISQQEFDAAQREQMDRFRQILGAQFDPKMFDTPEAKQNILDNLIAQRALAAEAARDHLSVSDRTLQQSILDIPGLANKEGKFDSERYKSLLAMQGMTPAMYEARLRHDLALQQINAAIQTTAFAPKTVATQLSNLNDQERNVQELTLKTADYVSQVKITEDMLKSYYDKNGGQFEIPEMAKADYVVLNSDALTAQITVSDADIKAYYEQNAKRFGTEEQRRASHILIAVKKDASAADHAAAKAKAEKVLAQLRKNPGDFAKLAKQNSEDTGSAERGGDLDYFGKGMMVKPFEDAAYKLKQGEISDIVQSDFGYHIIQLTGVKPASIKSLDEVKGEVATEIKKQLAVKKFAELAEIFTNTVYEQSDSLKPVADKLKLKIETASNLTRQSNPSLPANVPYNNEKFLKVLFSDESIKNKRNTDAVEVAPNTLIAGHIVEYKAVSKQPFDEVKDKIRERVTQIEAASLAKKAGETRLALLKQQDDASGFSDAKTVSRSRSEGLNRAALTAVMKADVTKLPVYTGVEESGKGYSIYRIIKVSQPVSSDPARRQAEQQQIENALAQQEMLSYIDVLKQKAKAKILKPVAASAASVETN
ncbi:MAG TPA: SurA N-terminal domain-containing protein [Burkholderiaceae bacterium]|nr:SurA N-terminal domain-containing protein [Burkholderiaceae bacterium]